MTLAHIIPMEIIRHILSYMPKYPKTIMLDNFFNKMNEMQPFYTYENGVCIRFERESTPLYKYLKFNYTDYIAQTFMKPSISNMFVKRHPVFLMNMIRTNDEFHEEYERWLWIHRIQKRRIK